MDDYTYSIPKKLVRKGQMEGITSRDLAFAVIMIALGAACFLTTQALGITAWAGAIGFAILALTGVGLVIPLTYKENLLLVLTRRRQYSDSQKRFIYKRYSGRR